MQKLTQSRADNCWQTCVAMLLGVPAEKLPAQHEYERPRYGTLLRVFLDKHFGCTYVEGPIEQFEEAREQIGFHILLGESPRTTPENPTWHAIIGERGQPFWDVNPSRDGLTSVKGWGLLIPTPPAWRDAWKDETCVCPACSAEKAVA